MARIIVKKSDGKLAVYSTIVDEFIIDDATVEQVVRMFMEDVRRSLEDRISRILRGEHSEGTYEECVRYRDGSY